MDDRAEEKFHTREISLPDGRYMVFYTFPVELSPPATPWPVEDKVEDKVEDTEEGEQDV